MSSQPIGIACRVERGVLTGACSARFDADVAVTLHAAADSLSEFAGWQGACAGTSDCALGASRMDSVTAVLRGPRIAVVATELTTVLWGQGGHGSGTVTIAPGDVRCAIVDNAIAGPCETETFPGEPVTVVVEHAPDEAGVVASTNGRAWGQLCTFSTGTPLFLQFICSGALTQSRAELKVALYRTILNASLAASTSTGRGWVRSDVGGIACRVAPEGLSGTCGADIAPGTAVTLTYEPDPGTVFLNWGGDCGTTLRVPVCRLTMDRSRRSFTVQTTGH
ncbi:hypothetical protein J421_1581 [Gemmatirosa kalamazoonensis]|uniref:Bacterial repeat domain-containing protein n=1 Tax=Gemmatirosa kalamazoonensis TaxID=861299 RepID=W0RI84_9BACT|nr:hypothetical protein J421_1581 [Gemmatirosa kalamazoonensis]